MSETPNNRERDTKVPASDEAVPFMFGAMLDTTWRMFVPTIGLTLLGVWLDTVFQTKPWLMIIGIVLGVLFAGILVWRQVKRSMS